MQCCQFAKSVTERGSERLCSARPVAVSSAPFQQAVLHLQPQTVQDVGNEAQSGASASAAVLEHTCNAIQPRARPSNTTSTPRRRDEILLLCTFFALVLEGSVFPI